MRIFRVPFLRLTAACALLCGCFKVAGGTSETTNGDLAVAITYANGTPATSVRVLVVDDEDWIGEVSEGRNIILDSGYTDSNGVFGTKLPFNHRCNLQIDGDREGRLIRDVGTTLPGKAIHPIVLVAYGSISGGVRPASANTIRELRLGGTAYASLIGSDSTFVFPAVPAGTYPIVAVAPSEGARAQSLQSQTVEVAAGTHLTGLSIPLSQAGRTLIDNFEHGIDTTELGRILGGGT